MDNLKDVEKVERFTPQVTFDLNPGLNALLLSETVVMDTKPGGADIKKILIGMHPGVASFTDLPDDRRLEEVKKYLFTYYKEHAVKIEKSVIETKKAWNEFAPTFFREVKKIFPNTTWPNGQYTGHIIVSPPCPRFLDTKTFCTPGNVENSIETTAHEMLHFIFYEYVRNRYLSDMTNTIEKEMDRRLDGKLKVPLWDLSEIFNLMILSGDEWGVGRNDPNTSSYVKLREQLPEFQKIWDETNRNIDEFFTKIET